MISIDEARLRQWLPQQRWFGGKGAPIAGIAVLDDARIADVLTLVVIEVRYATARAPELYLLEVQPRVTTVTGPGEEAIDTPAAALALLDIVRKHATLKTSAGTLRGERFAEDQLGAQPTVRRLGAEQSNTSIVFGDRVIAKLIRKLERGVNPELEVGAHLARRGFQGTPQLLGALSFSGAVDATVAVAHRFVKVDSDGWSYVLDAFRREDRPSPALLAQVRDLGARVGALHAALADDAGDAAFRPEPITHQDLQRWAATLEQELERTLEVAKSAVPQLARERAALHGRIAKLAAVSPSGVRIRVHGDLHLGQTLRSGGEWLIFDFEGEPARPLHERREKLSPLKDVAGMLRSFAYADATVELEGKPGTRLAAVHAAFLEGYRGAAAALLPAPGAFEVILDALTLEKLLYELRYEIGHRPDWIRIPARDLLAQEDT